MISDFKLFVKLKEVHQRTIASDFDGTIATYDGWKGPDNFGQPMKNTIDKLKKEKQNGSMIVIHTCRLNPELQKDGVNSKELLMKWLADNDVPYDDIWVGEGKPIADEYWDDRAVNVKDLK